MKNLPHVDIAIVGGGWTGLLAAKEIGSRTPLSITGIERGGPRGTGDYLAGLYELDYSVLFHMMQYPSQQTVTLRHNSRQSAYPIRQYGSFLPATGVGG